MLTNPVNYQLQFPNVPKRERSTGQAGESREKERRQLLSRTRRAAACSTEETALLGRSPGRGVRSASGCLEQRVREHGVFGELPLERPVL